jgi:hypothetical protein
VSARDAATSAADFLSNPSAWISRAPAGRIPAGVSQVASGLERFLQRVEGSLKDTCSYPGEGASRYYWESDRESAPPELLGATMPSKPRFEAVNGQRDT